MMPTPTRSTRKGFTLTELAVVLVIVALVIGGLLMPLAAQDDLRRTQETQKALRDIHDALLGFSAAQGRLPCPATGVSNGYESFCQESGGQPYTNCTVLAAGPDVFPPATPYRCSDPYGGFIPAATLGLTAVSANKISIDSWGNHIRYAIAVQANSLSPAYDFTTPDGMRNRTLPELSSSTSDTYRPDLKVCESGTVVVQAGVTIGPVAGLANCTGGFLTDRAVAVIFSLGKNSAVGGNGLDERHNPNPNSGVGRDRVFVSHTPTPRDAPNGEFDDIVIWLSPNILFNRMIAAGRLP